MLPTVTHQRSGRSSHGLQGIPEYVRRMKLAQMDLEYAFWQMIYLLLAPRKVYRAVSWHNHTKNQWARDDPAFVVVMVFFLAVGSLAFAVAFNAAESLFSMARIMFSTILIDFFAVGFLISTVCWLLCNKFLVSGTGQGGGQSVELMYAFDVHCNSFFPFFLVSYIIQFALLSVILNTSWLALLLSNSMYFLAFGIYFYYTFLGYSEIPFLENTVCFLYPIPALFVGYVLTLIFGFNISVSVMNFYFL
mmetsp:Transcript_26724/g.74707  ORF Transcript_26724/g.74707 Transcript_26724/m.74707 type:complete len:248 (+) Transcript_26724:103-846(+)